ncbi:MAG: hypothetical protein HY225_04210 [Candidatus Vogelbacteria bacterium]|nr:hypothetical protein [Candidatus Vogelbacteria bacterium]
MNLLPEKIKVEIRNEYYKKVAILFLVAVIISLVLATVPVILSYIMTSYQMTFLQREVIAMEKSNESKGIVSSLKIVDDLNNKLNILNRPMGPIPLGAISDILLNIVNMAKLLVHLTSFSYSQVDVKVGETKTTNYVIVVSGIADTRDLLLNFVKKLKADGTFTNVDLPIENLVESKNAMFSLNLTLTKK